MDASRNMYQKEEISQNQVKEIENASLTGCNQPPSVDQVMLKQALHAIFLGIPEIAPASSMQLIDSSTGGTEALSMDRSISSN